MGIIAKNTSKPRELPQKGQYLGVVSNIYDLGTQPAYEPGDSPQRQILVEFELHGKKGRKPVEDSEGRVFKLAQFYGLSVGRNKKQEKTKLRVAIEDITGVELTDEECAAGVDVGKLILEKVCLVKVDYKVDDNGKATRAFIATITAVEPEDVEDIEPVSDCGEWEIGQILERPEDDKVVPAWIRRMAAKSKEAEQKPAKAAGNGRASGKAQPAAAGARASTAIHESEGGSADDDEENPDVPF
jgi:hypothetical protein